MTLTQAHTDRLSVNAFRGDCKTLLALNLAKDLAQNLAGFTIQVQPPGANPYYLYNNLRFENPADHAQIAGEPANSSVNAPFQKFRWLHIPGSAHQGLNPVYGRYRYTIATRYFKAGRLQPLDSADSVVINVDVGPFQKGKLQLGFTRGFTQSQAYVRHFGARPEIQPKPRDLVFDTSQVSGHDDEGNPFTYAQMYEWSGFTARERIFELLEEVAQDKSLQLDVFAYDLNEPDLVAQLLKIGAEKRVRVILDSAKLHRSTATKPALEDEFEEQFANAAGKDRIQRRMFRRFAHDKVFVVSEGEVARTVLTGSTNFSVTGMYVNSNHVLVFDDPAVAKVYADVFDFVWKSDPDDKQAAKAFADSPWSAKPFPFSDGVPQISITFSPHTQAAAADVLNAMVQRINDEERATGREGNVLFAVMEMGSGKGENPVYDALCSLHADQKIFSYGISDDPRGIALYQVGEKTGVLVSGKPVGTVLPAPFRQVPGIQFGHQVHHKFVVCGLRGDDPVVYCGSSNLALLGEQENGDNLLAIRDDDVATVFAIEAISLVDHFDFLNRLSKKSGSDPTENPPPAAKQQAAEDAGWHLSTDDKWAGRYFDPNDLHCVDRELFGG